MNALRKRPAIWATAVAATATLAAGAAAQTDAHHHTAASGMNGIAHLGSAYGSHFGTDRAAVGRTAIATLGCTRNPHTADADRAAATNLGALGQLGEVTGRTVTHPDATNSTAQVSDVRLLGGQVTASAVGAVASATAQDGTASSAGDTHIAGLTVAGKHITIPAGTTNRKITVPGTATLLINHQTARQTGAAAVRSVTAMRLTLTHKLAGLPRGTVLNIGHAVAGVTDTQQGLVHGQADGSHVIAASGTVESGPTFRQLLGCLGTDGKPQGNAGTMTAQNGLVHAGNVNDTARGDATSGTGQTRSRVSGLNLLHGAVRAKVVQAVAGITGEQADTTSRGTRVVGLVVAGHHITKLTKPNQRFTVPGVGTLVANQVTQQGRSITVHGLDLTLAKRFGRLARGTEITIADARVARR